MRLEEYKKLSIEDRLNFLKKKYKEEIEDLVKDFQNDAPYLYLEYDYYKDKSKEQLENYLLKTVDGFLTTKEDKNGFNPEILAYQGWKILKEDGFTSCFLEASTYGYEAYDALEDPEEEDEDYDDYEDDVDESNYDPYTGGPVWESQKAWKDNNTLREFIYDHEKDDTEMRSISREEKDEGRTYNPESFERRLDDVLGHTYVTTKDLLLERYADGGEYGAEIGEDEKEVEYFKELDKTFEVVYSRYCTYYVIPEGTKMTLTNDFVPGHRTTQTWVYFNDKEDVKYPMSYDQLNDFVYDFLERV